MTKEKLIELLTENVVAATESITTIEKTYSCTLPDVVKHFATISQDELFLDDGKRILSNSEIVNASKELQVDFVAKKLVPLIDCCDNDFVVYSLDDDKWSLFNIVDEVQFMTRTTLDELIYAI